MPFGPGNQAAVGYGRPRRLDREVARLAEAAAHARALAESRATVALLESDPEIAAILERRVGEGLDALNDLERQLATLRWLAESVDQAEQKPGRRRRKHSPDPWETEVMAAALALDRLLPQGTA